MRAFSSALRPTSTRGRTIPAIVCWLGIMTVSPHAFAQDPRELDEFRYISPAAALHAGDFDAVRALLKPKIEQGSHEPNDLFLMGLTEKRAGNHELAIDYFQRLITLAPDSPRVRLEMAESLYILGRYEAAENELNTVLAGNPPETVSQRIQAYLAAIEQRLDVWDINFSVGSLYDSNVNAGPDTDTVYIGNLPFTLNNAAQSNSDWAAELGINLGYNKALNQQTSLRGGARIDYTDYRDMDNYDALVGSAWFGPGINLGRLYVYLPAVTSIVRLGHDESYYQKSMGLSPQVGYQINREWSVSGRLTWQDVDYKLKTSPDSVQTRLDTNIRYTPNNSLAVGAGIYFGRESSETDVQSNKRLGMRTFVDYVINDRWNTGLSADYSRVTYDGIQPFWDTERVDKKAQFSVSLYRTIPEFNARLDIGLSHTDQNSTIELYEYDRQMVIFTLSKDF